MSNMFVKHKQESRAMPAAPWGWTLAKQYFKLNANSACQYSYNDEADRLMHRLSLAGEHAKSC